MDIVFHLFDSKIGDKLVVYHHIGCGITASQAIYNLKAKEPVFTYLISLQSKFFSQEGVDIQRTHYSTRQGIAQTDYIGTPWTVGKHVIKRENPVYLGHREIE